MSKYQKSIKYAKDKFPRISRRNQRWILIFLVMFFVAFFQYKDDFTTNDLTAIVTSVYDGDTFRARVAEIPGISKIRLRDIDCFERNSKVAKKQVKRQMKRFNITQEEVYARGDKAKVLLEELFKVSENSIVIHIKPKDIRDKYGRILARVTANGVDVAEELLKSGVCFPYIDPKNTKG